MTAEGPSFTLIDGVLEPIPVDVAMKVPNEKADHAYSPAPDWVVTLLRSVNACEPYPNSKRSAGSADDRRRHHMGVWERLVRRLPVTSQAKLVASVLAEHWPTVKPSLRRIGELSSLSRSSVDNGIYVLKLGGLLQLESDPGRPTVYRPCYPVRAVTADEVALAKRWRRERRPEPAHLVDGSEGGVTREPAQPAGQVGAQPATPGAQPADDTHPPGGHEVSKQAEKQDVKASPGAGAHEPDAIPNSPEERRAYIADQRRRQAV